MSLQQAFGIGAEDIRNVLADNKHKLLNRNSNLSANAEDIFDNMDDATLDRIAKAALNSGTEMDEQTEGAYDEIKKVLIEQGVLSA